MGGEIGFLLGLYGLDSFRFGLGPNRASSRTSPVRLITVNTHVNSVCAVIRVFAVEGTSDPDVRAYLGVASFTAREAAGGVRIKHKTLMRGRIGRGNSDLFGRGV